MVLFDKNDKYHHHSVDFIKRFNGKLLSTFPVLTEVCYLLDFSVKAQVDFLKWVKNGAIQLIEINKLDLSRIIELTGKYADLPMDFADSSIVAIGDRLNVSLIATVDSDFHIYRFRRKKAFTNIFFDS